MSLRLMTSAALTLGLSAFAPSLAKADHYAGARGDAEVVVRVEHDGLRGGEYRHERDFDSVVIVREVPGCVMETAERVGNGRHVESARYVRHDDHAFYVFRMEGFRKDDIIVRVAPDGQLIDLAHTGVR